MEQPAPGTKITSPLPAGNVKPPMTREGRETERSIHGLARGGRQRGQYMDWLEEGDREVNTWTG
jgi:hypothetical protein